MNDKRTQFVLHYYERSKLDTQKAIRRFEARTHFRRSYRWRIVAVAACIALVAGSYLEARRWLFMTEYAAAESPRTCVLPDGSRVELAPQATLRFRRISPRNVRMTGTAYFEVVRNPAKPFDIEGRMSHVRVLGTKFQVAEDDTSSQVYVTQGKVLFAARDREDGVILTRGMSATLQKGIAKPAIDRRPAVNAMAWKTHQLHFDDTPITDVLADLQRCYHVKLHTSDTEKRLTGDFHVGDLDETITIIEQTLDIQIEQEP